MKKHVVKIGYGLAQLSKLELEQRARATFYMLATKELLEDMGPKIAKLKKRLSIKKKGSRKK